VTTVPAQHSSPAPAPPDLAAIKSRQQATWASGDYSIIGTTLTIVGESLCEAVDLRAARELVRVVRPGGKIGVASWTPDGFIGQLFALVGRTVPPPAGLKGPPLWGSVPYCEQLFEDGASSIRSMHREFTFRYRSPEHFIETFRNFYGPTHKLYAALPEDRARVFTAELTDLIARHNRADDGTLVVPSKYLELVVTRR